jgi:nucleotide-binding universal stress UspA family protein
MTVRKSWLLAPIASRSRVGDPRSVRSVKVTVVGYDGSLAGRNLVEAAIERLDAGQRLIIVQALEREADSPSYSSYERTLQRMVSALASILEGVEYELRVVHGPAAPALIEAARRCDASAIVIGTRKPPLRIDQRTTRSVLEAGPIPIIALSGKAERETHPNARRIDPVQRLGLESFPASDPPPTWGGSPVRSAHPG